MVVVNVKLLVKNASYTHTIQQGEYNVNLNILVCSVQCDNLVDKSPFS